MPGDYTVTITSAQFTPLSHEVVLEVGQHMALNLTLQVGEKHESVAVIGTAETLKTQDVSLGEVVEPKSIDSLPLNGRMLLDLVLTVPGAHLGHGVQTGDMNPLYWRPGQRSAVTIGGNRPNANYFLIDGVTNTEPTFNTQNLSLSPDAVQEFQVQTGSGNSADGGGGGQINIVTRAGTSQFHGTAYDYLRNNALDARTWKTKMPGTNFLVQKQLRRLARRARLREEDVFLLELRGLAHDSISNHDRHCTHAGGKLWKLQSTPVQRFTVSVAAK